MIISTTITSSRAGIIGDALRSVQEHVDKCLLIDVGIDDLTIEIAHEIVGKKLVVIPFELDPHDFSAARNFALKTAADIGGTWAITLDTDERLYLPPTLREGLSRVTGDVLLVKHVDGSYAKERMFRLPADPCWRGHAHEYYELRPGVKVSLLRNVSFDELQKTMERQQEIAARSVADLLRWADKEPTNPRWWYYLGKSYLLLDQTKEAVKAFKVCALLAEGWPEQRAMAAYHVAQETRNVDWCCTSMAIQPTAVAAALAHELDPCGGWGDIAAALDSQRRVA